MGLVADLGDQHQRGRILAQIDLFAPVGKHQFFQPDLAALAFFHTHDAREVQPERREHLARHAHLALAAVDQHQVRQARHALGPGGLLDPRRRVGRKVDAPGLARGLGHLAVTASEHLAHGGVVVSARDAFDLVAAVFAALHLVVVEHHARGLGGFARRVRDVKALDGELVQVFGWQVQCLGQRAGARLLRAFLGQQPGQLQVGVLLRHVQPGAALLARLVDGMHAHTALLGQRRQQGLVHRHAGHQQRRHGHADVVLGDEGFQHQRLHRARSGGRDKGRALFPPRTISRWPCILGAFRVVDGGSILHMHRKVRPIAQVPPAAHHGQVHAGAAALHAHGQNVHILVVDGLDGLLVQHARQSLNLVAHLGRLFKLQLVGMRHHSRLQRLQQFLGFTTQQGLGVLHVGGIGLGRNQFHAGPRAALDLIEQARPRAVGKNRVFAGAQPEHLLQQLDGFFHRPGAGIGAEIAVLFVYRAAVIGHARKQLAGGIASGVGGARDFEVGVALVVAEQDVELGVQRLDEVVFQQQRLGLGAHHRGFHAHDLADHVADARAAMVLLEIAGHPALEVERLAHVKQRVLRVEIAVNTGQRGQRSHLRQQFFGMHIRHGAYCGRALGSAQRPPLNATQSIAPSAYSPSASGQFDHYSASIFELFTTCAQLARSALTLSPSCSGVW